MMETFESQMKKVFYKNGKLKEYIASLGVKSQINEDKFHENKNGKMVCDVLICFPDEYEKFSSEHEKFQSQIQSLQKEISEKKKSIEIMQNQLSSIDAQHEKKIEELDAQYSGEIEQLKEDLHQKDLEIERTKTKYEKEIGKLNASHQRHLKELKLFDEEIHMSIAAHQNQMNDLKIFDEESHMSIIKHIEEITDLKESHQKEFSGMKDAIVREVIHHNDDINDLENSLSFWEYLKGDYKKQLTKLKEDNEQFMIIAQYIESKENAILQDVKFKEEDEDSS